jgi:EAL domain-containing protein (putative c-di-GMP-specific phosphodiesterase class I)
MIAESIKERQGHEGAFVNMAHPLNLKTIAEGIDVIEVF